MAGHSLYLFPDDPSHAPDPGALQDLLAESGLTNPRPLPDGRLSAGPEFLACITFLGCAPQVSLTEADAAEGQPVCRIRLHYHDTPVLLVANPPPAVRCPACRARVTCPPGAGPDTLVACEACARESMASSLDWRHGAGAGRCFIEIEHVFPHEAVPADSLLKALATLGTGWRYFYD
ncbi:MAG TPA: hypothetical protein ENJ79_07365 [Gammaproteobacteria bacterium]|nr:hypothetical protein [Gammaproteobacteria bacterium]